ncbi:MAG: hypothetical protein KC502_20400, partial [Myxococcales bacterium]|nr:hypothetical protein [Myxococcales bacterium]
KKNEARKITAAQQSPKKRRAEGPYAQGKPDAVSLASAPKRTKQERSPPPSNPQKKEGPKARTPRASLTPSAWGARKKNETRKITAAQQSPQKKKGRRPVRGGEA